MLKIKHISFLLFLVISLIFCVSMYFLTKSYLDILLAKQYEQKLKTLDDTLRFALLKDINASNIKEFAETTRIDLLIKHKNEIISSLSNPLSYLYENNFMLREDAFKDKKILSKDYTFEDYEYILIVYPRILELEGFWDNLFFDLLMCFLLMYLIFYFFFLKIKKYATKALLFLDNIHTKGCIVLEKPPFKEFELLNEKLIQIKTQILKNQDKTKKQSDKIALKNTQLSSVISAISHELKNPLSVIDMSVDLLAQNLENKEKNLILDKISNQSKKINMLTNKLNLVFNLGESSLNLTEFDMYILCENLLKNPGFERVILQGEHFLIKADAFLIEQVIINLLSNALKYSQKEVILSLSPEKICIKDFGIGIKEEDFKLITKKFYKINPNSENSFGLGLFLVKKILSLHQSYLHIKSEPNKGSEFSFALKSH